MENRPVPLALAVSLCVALASPARAETYASGLFGITFAGAATVHQPTYGGAVSFIGRHAGVEVELATTPQFLGDQPGSSSVTTLMANYVAGGHILRPGVKPYFVVGVGLVRPGSQASDVLSHISSNNFGLGIGGGAVGFLTDRIGIRGDIRYLRSLTGKTRHIIVPIAGDFDFWRVLVGIVVRL